MWCASVPRCSLTVSSTDLSHSGRAGMIWIKVNFQQFLFVWFYCCCCCLTSLLLEQVCCFISLLLSLLLRYIFVVVAIPPPILLLLLQLVHGCCWCIIKKSYIYISQKWHRTVQCFYSAGSVLESVCTRLYGVFGLKKRFFVWYNWLAVYCMDFNNFCSAAARTRCLS